MPLRSDGKQLRQRRELLGMTQAEFARQAGYTMTHVSQVELGHSNAGPRYLREAKRIFKCEMGEITNGEIPRRRPNPKTHDDADEPEQAVA